MHRPFAGVKLRCGVRVAALCLVLAGCGDGRETRTSPPIPAAAIADEVAVLVWLDLATLHPDKVEAYAWAVVSAMVDGGLPD